MQKFKELRSLREASLAIATDLDDYPVSKQAKKFKLKAKEEPGKGDGMYGPDKVTLTGSERDIIKYADEYLGWDGGKFKDLQKELGL